MVAIPTSINLYSSGGAQVFNRGAKIYETYYPLQGLNYYYAKGNRRTLFQASPPTPFSGPQTPYDRVPITMTLNKTSVTFYGEGENGNAIIAIKNTAGVAQGSGSISLAFGARGVVSATITGLTPSSANYIQVSLTGASVKLYKIQAIEDALTALP